MKRVSIKHYLVVCLLLLEVTSLFLTFKSYANKTIDEIENINVVDNKTFAMYIENDSGGYDELLDSTLFPTDTHELNYELTTCVDNKGNSVDSSILAYNDGKVTATSNKTVFCYLYFEYLPKAYAIYSETDNSLRFYKNTNYETLGDTYNGLAVTSLYTGFVNKRWYNWETLPWHEHSDTITNVVVEEEIQPISTANWFGGMTNTSYLDMTNLNTSQVIDMSRMFQNTGTLDSVTSFELKGIDRWDTSNVTNMSYLFNEIGNKASTWVIGDISNWNTSNVSNMDGLFLGAGKNKKELVMDLSKWNTSSVNSMRDMFNNFAAGASIWNIGNLNTKEITLKNGAVYTAWDVSNVTSMSMMFAFTGKNASEWNIGDISNWDTSNVTNMSYMFKEVAYTSRTFNIGDLASWDTSNVITMSNMFSYAGHNSAMWTIGDISNWDTSEVTNMSGMFSGIGSNVEIWTIGELNTKTVIKENGESYKAWDVSKVTDMSRMFDATAQKSSLWNIGTLSNWNTSKVTNMSGMFHSSGGISTIFMLDLSSWNISNVNSTMDMFKSAGIKALTWSIGDISNWNTSNVITMEQMFQGAAPLADSWEVGDISKWDTSNVTNMSYMFANTAKNSIYTLNLSSWNISNVVNYINFNYGVESKIIAPIWVTTTT